MGTKQAEHARSTFAVEAQSQRVHPERPRWPVVLPPAARRSASPHSPHRKRRGRALPPYSQFRSGTARAAGDAAAAYRAPPTSSKRTTQKVQAEAEDVIDLGAPRQLRRAPVEGPQAVRPRPRRPAPLQPNPRLYPGLPPRVKSIPLPKLSEKQRAENRRQEKRRVDQHSLGKQRNENRRAEKRTSGEKRRRRRKLVRQHLVPNPRLYRPPPVRPPPPPATPAAPWWPRSQATCLDTASRAALHLSEQRRASHAGLASAPRSPSLVVTLPVTSATAAPPQRYRPASAHFHLRSLDTDSGETTPVAGRPSSFTAAAAMDSGNTHSTSPEDRSDGAETLSAPSEFLAEFLSAIMRRQYAEALKYCRLILQYEPHNATARGFYPLLQHKVQTQQKIGEEWPRASSSEEASPPVSDGPAQRRAQHKQEMMEQGSDSTEGSDEEEGGASRPSSRSGGSISSQSSLEMDSSLSLSRRTEPTDSVSPGRCDSTGSASRSDADDNGNANTVPAAARLSAGDLQNDNGAVANETLTPPQLKSDSLASLRRLRAQFTCSIK